MASYKVWFFGLTTLNKVFILSFPVETGPETVYNRAQSSDSCPQSGLGKQ